MNFIKALWLALVEVFKLYGHSPKLLVELFWCVCGLISLVLSVVLFPVIVWRKYKEVSKVKGKRKVKFFKECKV